MSAGARLAIALAALVAIVAGGFVLGRVVDPGPAEDSSHDHGGAPSESAGDDFSVELVSEESFPAGETTLQFAVVDEDGARVTAYDERHEKDLHLIVVDKQDPRIYQHVHPEFADGVWSIDVDLGPGSYRLYADTQPAGAEPQVLTADLEADGSRPGYEPLPSPNRVATVDGFTVALAEARDTLSFSVERDGKAVELEPYLGAGGHLVAIRAEDLDYLHAHPGEGTDQPIGFHVEFDEPGRYVLHFDFQVDGTVRTATFVHDRHAEASTVPSASPSPTIVPLESGPTEESSGHEH